MRALDSRHLAIKAEIKNVGRIGAPWRLLAPLPLLAPPGLTAENRTLLSKTSTNSRIFPEIIASKILDPAIKVDYMHEIVKSSVDEYIHGNYLQFMR